MLIGVFCSHIFHSDTRLKIDSHRGFTLTYLGEFQRNQNPVIELIIVLNRILAFYRIIAAKPLFGGSNPSVAFTLPLN